MANEVRGGRKMKGALGRGLGGSEADTQPPPLWTGVAANKEGRGKRSRKESTTTWRCRTIGSRGRRDRDARSGASAGSASQIGPGTLGRGRSTCRNDEKEKGETVEGSV